MITSTTASVPNREITEILGVVKGNTVRARNIGRDVFAGLRSIVGGEIEEYTNLLTQAREQAIDRMISQAQRMNADAVINIRMTTSMVMQGSSEILAYGTAVKLN